jgi:hypothetical protein
LGTKRIEQRRSKPFKSKEEQTKASQTVQNEVSRWEKKQNKVFHVFSETKKTPALKKSRSKRK